MKELHLNDIIGIGFNPHREDHMNDKNSYIYRVLKSDIVELDSDEEDEDDVVMQEGGDVPSIPVESDEDEEIDCEYDNDECDEPTMRLKSILKNYIKVEVEDEIVVEQPANLDESVSVSTPPIPSKNTPEKSSNIQNEVQEVTLTPKTSIEHLLAQLPTPPPPKKRGRPKINPVSQVQLSQKPFETNPPKEASPSHQKPNNDTPSTSSIAILQKKVSFPSKDPQPSTSNRAIPFPSTSSVPFPSLNSLPSTSSSLPSSPAIELPARPILNRRKSIIDQAREKNLDSMTIQEKMTTLRHWNKPETKLIEIVSESDPMRRKRTGRPKKTEEEKELTRRKAELAQKFDITPKFRRKRKESTDIVKDFCKQQ